MIHEGISEQDMTRPQSNVAQPLSILFYLDGAQSAIKEAAWVASLGARPPFGLHRKDSFRLRLGFWVRVVIG